MSSTAKYFNVDVSIIKRKYKRGISYDNLIYRFETKDLRISVYDNNH